MLILRSRTAVSTLVVVIAIAAVVVVAGVGYYLAVGNRSASSSTSSSNANTIEIAGQAGCGMIGGSWHKNDSTPTGHFVCSKTSPLVISQGETVIVFGIVELDLMGNVTNYGTIIDKSCCLSNHTGGIALTGPYFFNYGLIMTHGVFDVALGPLEFHNYGTIVVFPNTVFFIHMIDNGVFVNEAAGTFVNHGKVVVLPFRSPTLKNAGNITNSSDGVIEFGDTTTFVNSGTTTNFGFISTSSIVMNSGAINDECGGTFFRDAGSSVSGNPIHQACSSTSTTA